MTTEAKVQVPTGKHAPVANVAVEAEEAEALRKAVLQAPSAGEHATAAVAVSGDHEPEAAVRREMTPAEEMWNVPDMAGLPDIGEASFGAPLDVAETVHGPDNRVQIHNTDCYPWRVHASLLITAADNSQWVGTGWFIGPHTLMTAGHCVCIKGSPVAGRNGWVKKIQVMPGRNGNTLPYGSVTSSNFRSVRGWVEDGDENYDYGAIILSTDLGARTGWFGFGVWPDAELVASTGNIAGYPADQAAGTLWYDFHKIASVNARKVYYDIDTFGGQSGSAVYRIISGKRYGIAIHAYGGATTNSGTRISTPVFNNMVAWKA